MTRVGIVTINDYQNYGNRLQNYALQEFLSDQGFTPRTILNRSEDKAVNRKAALCRVADPMRLARETPKAAGRHIRGAAMRRFDRRHLLVTERWVEAELAPTSLAESFDIFIVGSDQVWNPTWRGTDLDFLTFAPPEKRVSYAASFGVSALPPDVSRRYAHHLSRMRAISVRESDGAQLVRHLTGHEVPVHVDPVMLLDSDRWRRVTAKHTRRHSHGRRVLTYFLGVGSPARTELVDLVAKRADTTVVRFLDRSQPHHYISGPSRFIAEIDASDLVITDSFHAAAFAILFGKPFIVVPRHGVDEMGSRLRTLLRTFRIEIAWTLETSSPAKVFQSDPTVTGPILEIERKRARDYFRAVTSG